TRQKSMPLKRGRLQTRARIASGKCDTKCSAEPGCALDADVAGMLLDDAVSDGETKAGAAADSLRGEKRIVNFRDVFGSNADAIVGDFDGQRVLVSVFGRQHDTAVAVRDRIAGIQDQVREDLLQFY